MFFWMRAAPMIHDAAEGDASLAGARLLAHLYNSSFSGVSGPIQFEGTTGNRDQIRSQGTTPWVT